jgi:hypothetical protein
MKQKIHQYIFQYCRAKHFTAAAAAYMFSYVFILFPFQLMLASQICMGCGERRKEISWEDFVDIEMALMLVKRLNLSIINRWR